MVKVYPRSRYRVRVYLNPNKSSFMDFFFDFRESVFDFILENGLIVDVHEWSSKARDYSELVYGSEIHVDVDYE